MAAIDNLAKATAQGFADVDIRFNWLANEMNGMNGRFEKLEYSMNKRFDSVDLRFDAFDRRLQILEART